MLQFWTSKIRKLNPKISVKREQSGTQAWNPPPSLCLHCFITRSQVRKLVFGESKMSGLQKQFRNGLVSYRRMGLVRRMFF